MSLSFQFVQLWQNFFELAVAFSCQPILQMEALSEVKRNRVLDRYVYHIISMCVHC